MSVLKFVSLICVKGETLTLLVLSQELSPSLSMVESLHKLHTSAVLDWKHTPNWLCATQ